MISPILGVAATRLNAQLRADVEGMAELVEAMPTTHAPAPTSTSLEDSRALYQLLDELDPGHFWGGLLRVATPDGLTLYLCSEHAAGYRYPR